MTRSILSLGICLVATIATPSVADAETKKQSWKLSLESGAEYDSNLHRLEVLEGEVAGAPGGPLMRTGAHYQVGLRPTKRSRLQLDLRGASKIFAVSEGQSENLAILFADTSYQQVLGTSRAKLGIRANYYDAIDVRPFGDGERPVPGRSFRSGEAEVGLTLPSEGEHRTSLFVGMRDFTYKPDANYDWRGQQVGLRYAALIWLGDPDADEDAASIDLRGYYRLGLRRYQGTAFRNACAPGDMPVPRCFVPTQEQRADLNHSGAIEGIYTGSNIYSLLYGAELVDSNSFGQALVRQRVEAALTTELPVQLFLTARAIVRINTFLDPLLLARDIQDQSFVSVEDENRNSLSLHIARDLGRHWAAEARVAIYSNEFATEELRFRRQTAYLGLLYRFHEDSRLGL